MDNKRVVITGLGVIAANGNSKDDFWESIVKGKSGIGEITRFDSSSYPCNAAAEIKNFDPTRYISSKKAKRTDRHSQLGLCAAIASMKDSGVEVSRENRRKIGVFEGTSLGGLDCVFLQHGNFLKKGLKGISPFVMYNGLIEACSGEISLELKLEGPSFTMSTGSAAASDAIGIGYTMVKSGDIDIALVGGAEAPILPPIVAMFCHSRVLAPTSTDVRYSDCFKAFDKNRQGFILGEGAGYLVLEELERALKRKARIYAELVGYGKTCDAYHITSPHPDGRGIVFAMKEALREAKLSPEDINYINAHGTGTVLNDAIETKAIKEVFGKYAYKLPISSTKPITGHLLGACGGVEAVICVLAIENNIIPPTINYKTPDPACDLDYVIHSARKSNINNAISCCYGFGGKNSILIFKRYRD